MKPPLDDCMCPICLEILIEPVTMPCQHELCMPCFQHNVQEANFFCPLCRLRISSWARAAANDHKLIDQHRWREIRKFYPNEVASRMSGRSDYESVVMPPVHEIPRTLSEPGEIRREFEEEMRKFDEQLRMEHEQEETASRLFIEKLHTIDAAQMQLAESDERIARDVQNLDTSEDVQRAISVLRNDLDKQTKIYSNYDRLRKETSTPIDAKVSSACPVSNEYSPSNKPLQQKIMYDKKDVEEFSRLVRQNSCLPIENCFKSPSRRPNPATIVIKNRKLVIGRSVSCDVEAMNKLPEHQNHSKTYQPNGDGQATCSRPVAETEADSITEEVNHFFRPIDDSPLTPPKELPNGRSDLQAILLVTPLKISDATCSTSVAQTYATRKKSDDCDCRKIARNLNLSGDDATNHRRIVVSKSNDTAVPERIHKMKHFGRRATTTEEVENCLASLKIHDQRTPAKSKKSSKRSENANSQRNSRSPEHHDDVPIAKRTRSSARQGNSSGNDEIVAPNVVVAALSACRKRMTTREIKPMKPEQAKRKLQFSSSSSDGHAKKAKQKSSTKRVPSPKRSPGRPKTPLKLIETDDILVQGRKLRSHNVRFKPSTGGTSTKKVTPKKIERIQAKSVTPKNLVKAKKLPSSAHRYNLRR